MKGIDSDNGNKFKNMELLQWCKNNNSVVRSIVSYYQFEAEATRNVMAELYEHNMTVNFFSLQ